MKKIMFSMLVAASLLTACSSSDDSNNNTNEGGFSNDPVSGVIYSENFTIGGGKARPITLGSVESLYIYLAPAALDCETTGTGPIWITVPAQTGTYTPSTDGHVQFRDQEAGSFEGSVDATIEITSITETTVTGKVMATGFDDAENSINGTFSVQYCPL